MQVAICKAEPAEKLSLTKTGRADTGTDVVYSDAPAQCMRRLGD